MIFFLLFLSKMWIEIKKKTGLLRTLVPGRNHPILPLYRQAFLQSFFHSSPKLLLINLRKKENSGRILDAGLLKLLKVIMKIEYAKEKSRNSPQNLVLIARIEVQFSLKIIVPFLSTLSMWLPIHPSLPWSADGIFYFPAVPSF